MYEHKRVLVSGGTGMMGRQVVELLTEVGANVTIADFNPVDVPKGVGFRRGDLTKWEFCREIVRDIDYVFHLAAPKGGVAISAENPSSIFVNGLLMNTHLMEAARQAGVERYLFTSSISIYPADAQIFREEEGWSAPPHPTNTGSGWAKRMGELQAEAYSKEYGWNKIAIVRPANSYGPGDNFDLEVGHVIPVLVRRAVERQDPYAVWGSGRQVRDHIYSRDVAKGMLLALEKYACCDPINLCTGVPLRMEDLVETIVDLVGYRPKVVWDTSKPEGQKVRVMDPTKMKEKLGFHPETSLEDGLRKTIGWYEEHRFSSDDIRDPRRRLV